MKPRAEGWTLIELLTALGIIAMLAAILYPVLANSRRAALRTTCIAQLRQIGIAVRMYRNDQDELPPRLSAMVPTYITDPSILVCPRDGKRGQHKGNPRLEGNLYLPSGVSYTYVPNWEIARQLGWWLPGPPYGEGKWGELTPLSECHWHWAGVFRADWLRDRLPKGTGGWILVLTLNGAVRKVRVELPPEDFTPDHYQ